MNSNSPILTMLVISALIACGGCHAWTPSKTKVDSAWADEIDYMRQTAQQDTESELRSKQSAIEARNMRLSPAVEIGVNEIRPSLQHSKEGDLGLVQGVSRQPKSSEEIIVLSAQTPERGQRLRPNPKLLKKQAKNSKPPESTVTMQPGNQQPPVHLRPNQKIVEAPPKIPLLPNLQPKLAAEKSSGDVKTWDSEQADEFEQPGTEWMQKNWQASNEVFLANSQASFSNLIPPNAADRDLLDQSRTKRLPNKKTRDLPVIDSEIQQVAHFEETENATTHSDESAEDTQKQEETGSDETAGTSEKIASNEEPNKAPETSAKPLDVRQTIRDLIVELDKQLNAENFQNLPSREQERIRLSQQLLNLVQQSSEKVISGNDNVESNGKGDIVQNSKLLREVLPLITKRYSENSDFEVVIEKLKRDLASRNIRPDGLRLGAAHFCTEISGFGKIKKLASDQFRPRQRALVYCEIEGFQSVPTEDQMHATYLRGAYEITDEVGVVVQARQFPQIVDKSSSKRRDFYIHLPVKLDSLQPGSYELQVIVADQTSHESARLPVPLKFIVSPVSQKSR